MSHAGSSPNKAAKEKGDNNSTNEQGKKNKLFLVKQHGKVEIKQRGKDWKLRPLNWPEKSGKSFTTTTKKHGQSEGSAMSSSPEYNEIAAERDLAERELARVIDREKEFAERGRRRGRQGQSDPPPPAPSPPNYHRHHLGSQHIRSQHTDTGPHQGERERRRRRESNHHDHHHPLTSALPNSNIAESHHHSTSPQPSTTTSPQAATRGPHKRPRRAA